MREDIRECYTYVTNNEDETQYIGLTPKAERWQGVIYKYGKVAIPNEINSESDLNLRFDYDIVDNNSMPPEWLESEEFTNLIGDVLVDIMDQQLEQGELQFNEPND